MNRQQTDQGKTARGFTHEGQQDGAERNGERWAGVNTAVMQ